MLLKIRVGDDVFSKDVSWDELVELKELLKKLGFRWNPETKEWVRETPPPCGEALGTLSTWLLVKLPCTHEVRIFRNYAYCITVSLSLWYTYHLLSPSSSPLYSSISSS